MTGKQMTMRMRAALEFLPACRMNFYRAGIAAGYSSSYSRTLARKFANDPRLQDMFLERIQRVLAEANQSDRAVVADLLQQQHLRAHPVNGMVFAAHV